MHGQKNIKLCKVKERKILELQHQVSISITTCDVYKAVKNSVVKYVPVPVQ